MATLKGWNFEYGKDTKPCIYAADITEGNVLTASDGSTSPVTVAVAGAGAMPLGVAPKTLDISEDGARGTMVVKGLVPVVVAAAVTDITVPLKCAASGQATPCTADQDIILGMPQHTAAINTVCLVDLSTMGAFFAIAT